MDPLVSVVIPNHNGARTIARCLGAAFASDYGPLEVVVVDDGSTDDSVNQIRRFPCRLVRLARRSGAAAARNAGAQASRGEVLFFTDADCLLEPQAVARAVASLGGGPNAAVGGTYTLAGCEPGFFDRFQSAFVHYFETRFAPHADYLATHALALPASIFRRHGGFARHGLPILEDVEFSHRLRRGGCRLIMDPTVQACHVFGFSLLRSLRNAFRKSHYWTCYSLGAGDILGDSGTASRELKLNVAAWCLCAALLAGAAAGSGPAWLALAAGVQGANVYANRGLLRAMRRAHGTSFAAAAALYYLLVYPVAVGAGALAGLCLYAAHPRRASEAA